MDTKERMEVVSFSIKRLASTKLMIIMKHLEANGSQLYNINFEIESLNIISKVRLCKSEDELEYESYLFVNPTSGFSSNSTEEAEASKKEEKYFRNTETKERNSGSK